MSGQYRLEIRSKFIASFAFRSYSGGMESENGLKSNISAAELNSETRFLLECDGRMSCFVSMPRGESEYCVMR